jgi:hypothetical protein
MKILLSSICLSILSVLSAQAQKINRQALVSRHNVVVEQLDSLSALTIGNGRFAFTVDATGLQTFPAFYKGGIPLGTQSEWGWNSFKDTSGFRIEESLRDYDQYGRKVSYTVQIKTPERNRRASDWFRQNVHRLQLGNVGLDITLKNGKPALAKDLSDIDQLLDLWTGEIHSSFSVEGEKVEVYTVAHQQRDQVSARIRSSLLGLGRLKVRIRYPYPTGNWADVGVNYASPDKHTSVIVSATQDHALIRHQLDSAGYLTALHWTGSGNLIERSAHDFILSPVISVAAKESAVFEFSCAFSIANPTSPIPLYMATQQNSKANWSAFWKSGGAVDFSGSTDIRANELERRVVLSQYLTRVQCAGSAPPQETGLTYNSWFGKPHLEMTWWHMLHYALWGRTAIMEKTTDWYFKVAGAARKIAQRQGFEGLRWQKMTDNNGNESPSSVGALLIWQQPHLITFAEMAYRAHPNKATLDKYKELVFGTADFMASFAYFDKAKNRYFLGPGLIPAQERFKAEETFNPTYELAYWHWALNRAQQWWLKSGLPRNAKWDNVISKLSPLPIQDGHYLAAESAPDSYTNPEYKTDHPSVLGTFGMLPATSLLDKAVMKNTFDLVWNTWSWNDTWGWDFPMTAMTAARLGLPDKAIDALMMKVQTNTYLLNGHNYQDDRLRMYLPGNGGLLTAVAMMCAGWDGNTVINPGFPKDGTWKVKWEGLQPMP